MNPLIPDDDDINAMRIRYARSLNESLDRREQVDYDRPDRVSDMMIAVVMVGLIIALVVAALLGHDVSTANGADAAPRIVHLDRREAILRAVCPNPGAMPRRVCERWLRVAQCETGDPADRVVSYASVRRIRWRYNGSSGYDGAVQFSVRTWRGNIGRVPARHLTRVQRRERARGAYGVAWAAPAPVQILTAEALRVRLDGGGLQHWPRCGSRWRG